MRLLKGQRASKNERGGRRGPKTIAGNAIWIILSWNNRSRETIMTGKSNKWLFVWLCYKFRATWARKTDGNILHIFTLIK